MNQCQQKWVHPQWKFPNWAQLAIFPPLVLQGLMCEWRAGVLNLVLSLSHSLILVTRGSTWHLMAKNSLRIWKEIVVPHKDGLGCKKIANTLKLSFSTVAKTIQWFNRTGSTHHVSPWSTKEVEWHVLSDISRSCLWKIDVWVLPSSL